MLSHLLNSYIPSGPKAPYVVGQPLRGGFFAGQISTTADGVATHNMIISARYPDGEKTGYIETTGTHGSVGATSLHDGPTNTTLMAAAGANFYAATYCKSLTLGGYNDWYLPSFAELLILYYYFKPTTQENYTPNHGACAYAVAPIPINQAFTTIYPAMTTISGFAPALDGFNAYAYFWSSTESATNKYHVRSFMDGANSSTPSTWWPYHFRAIRREAV